MPRKKYGKRAKSKRAIAYVDKNLADISEEKYQELLADDKYRSIRKYRNDKILVEAVWDGRITNSEQCPREYWTPFIFIVKNNIGTKEHPRFVDSPSETKRFRTQKAVEEKMDDFLMEWSDSYYTEEGEFVEEGNHILPPPPADMPQQNTEESGSW